MALPTPVLVQPALSTVPADLQGLLPSWDLMLQSSFAAAVPQWQKFAKQVPVGPANTLILPWVDRTKTLTPWVGERQYVSPISRTISVQVQPYELSVQIDKYQYMDAGNVGDFWKGIFSNFSNQIAEFPDLLVAQQLQLGTELDTYDGAAFFAPSNAGHPINPENPAQFGTQYNYFVNLPLTTQNFAQVLAQMKATRGADGQPFGAGMRGVQLIVPPNLELAARQIVAEMFGRPFASDGTNVGTIVTAAPESNMMFTKQVNPVEVVVVPQLQYDVAGTGYDYNDVTWYVADNNLGALSGVYIGMRDPFKIVPRIAETDPVVFDWHKLVFGVEGRCAAALGLYQQVIRATAYSV